MAIRYDFWAKIPGKQGYEQAAPHPAVMDAEVTPEQLASTIAFFVVPLADWPEGTEFFATKTPVELITIDTSVAELTPELLAKAAEVMQAYGREIGGAA